MVTKTKRIRRTDNQNVHLALARAIAAKKARDDLLRFAQFTMPDPADLDNPELSRYQPAAHHAAIARALQRVEAGNDLRTIITMPPRHGKTELASHRFSPWFVGRDPYREVIVSTYNQTFAEDHGRKIRDVMLSPEYAQVFPEAILKRDSKSAERLQLTEGGLLFFAGVGGAITGRGADLFLIDDPIKNRDEAESQTIRDQVWSWFTSTAYTRLLPGGRVIIILCMTGDTGVLMADGTTKCLRDVDIGDNVATYKDGKLSTSTVMNWANQGPDRVFQVTMRSGVSVKANERHPFLVDKGDRQEWIRLRNLKIGDRVLRAIGESGAALSARQSCSPSLNTYEIIGDEIVSITDAGIEDVYDIQVAGTENFIANGLVSHNTRWHEDDIVGRIFDPEYVDPKEAAKWKVLSLQAIAGDSDPLGRAKGEALWPARYPIETLDSIRGVVGARDWSALYQQSPTPDDGQYFLRTMFKPYQPEELPKALNIYGASDHAIGTKQQNDASVIGCIGVDEHDNIWILPDVVWGRLDAEQQVEAMVEQFLRRKPIYWWAEKGHITQSLGPFLRERQQETKAWQAIEEMVPTKDKLARSRGTMARAAMRPIRVPGFMPWWPDALDQLLKFPNGKHDDFVDWLSWIGIGLDRVSQITPRKVERIQDFRVGTGSWIRQQSRQENKVLNFRKRTSGW